MDIAKLKDVLIYDKDSGIFTWRKDRCWRSRAGGKAGTLATSQSGRVYLRISIDKRKYYTHRLAWLYHYGEFPAVHIDHIDGDSLNNRICNLRDVTPSENNKNSRMNRKNTSGVMGVVWSKQYKYWRARIKVDGKMLHYGCFDDFNDAVTARKAAELEHGFHANHGKPKHIR